MKKCQRWELNSSSRSRTCGLGTSGQEDCSLFLCTSSYPCLATKSLHTVEKFRFELICNQTLHSSNAQLKDLMRKCCCWALFYATQRVKIIVRNTIMYKSCKHPTVVSDFQIVQMYLSLLFVNVIWTEIAHCNILTRSSLSDDVWRLLCSTVWKYLRLKRFILENRILNGSVLFSVSWRGGYCQLQCKWHKGQDAF